MNPVTMTTIDPRKKYWPNQGLNQQLPELWGSASKHDTITYRGTFDHFKPEKKSHHKSRMACLMYSSTGN